MGLGINPENQTTGQSRDATTIAGKKVEHQRVTLPIHPRNVPEVHGRGNRIDRSCGEFARPDAGEGSAKSQRGKVGSEEARIWHEVTGSMQAEDFHAPELHRSKTGHVVIRVRIRVTS